LSLQQRTKTNLHAVILACIGQITLESINSKHRFGVGSLSPLDLAKELKATAVRHYHPEIAATEIAIALPFRNSNSSVISAVASPATTNSYRSLATTYRNSLELTCSLLPSIVGLNSKPTSVFGRPPPPSTNALSNHLSHISSCNTKICPLNRNLVVAMRFNSTRVGKRQRKIQGKRPRHKAPLRRRLQFSHLFPPHHSVLPSTPRTIAIAGTAASTPIQLRPLLYPPFPLLRNPITIVIFTVGTFPTAASPAKNSFLRLGDETKLHADLPTSTTPHGNAAVEPAYKSWQ
jgi:hypothetical protein